MLKHLDLHLRKWFLGLHIDTTKFVEKVTSRDVHQDHIKPRHEKTYLRGLLLG